MSLNHLKFLDENQDRCKWYLEPGSSCGMDPVREGLADIKEDLKAGLADIKEDLKVFYSIMMAGLNDLREALRKKEIDGLQAKRILSISDHLQSDDQQIGENDESTTADQHLVSILQIENHSSNLNKSEIIIEVAYSDGDLTESDEKWLQMMLGSNDEENAKKMDPIGKSDDMDQIWIHLQQNLSHRKSRLPRTSIDWLERESPFNFSDVPFTRSIFTHFGRPPEWSRLPYILVSKFCSLNARSNFQRKSSVLCLLSSFDYPILYGSVETLLVARREKDTEVIEQELLLLTKSWFCIATFSISSIRGLFLEKYFTDKSVTTLQMKIKKIMPQYTESHKLIDWMEKGVYSTLQKKYLQKLVVCVCEVVGGDQFLGIEDCLISIPIDLLYLDLNPRNGCGSKDIRRLHNSKKHYIELHSTPYCKYLNEVLKKVAEHDDTGSNRTKEMKLELLTSELRKKRRIVPPSIEVAANGKDVLHTLCVVTNLGGDSFGTYVISMASNAIDILVIELLREEAGLVNGGELGRPCSGEILRVKALFEIVKNLRGIGSVIREFILIDWYREHIIRNHNGHQKVKVGYSDSGISDKESICIFWKEHASAKFIMLVLLIILRLSAFGELVVESAMTNSFLNKHTYSLNNPYCKASENVKRNAYSGLEGNSGILAYVFIRIDIEIFLPKRKSED